MKRKSIVFIAACLGIASAVWAVQKAKKLPPKPIPIQLPTQKPYAKTVAASGIIEAVGNNIAVGLPVSGIVEKVYVEVWQQVKKGEPLFKLDTRELESEYLVAESKEKVAKAQYQKVADQLERLRSIKDLRAISGEELRSKENETLIALATVEQMEREKEKIGVLINRMTICSPIDGTVLQKNVKVGEFHTNGQSDRPSILMGDMTTLQVRIDVDEHNASFLSDGLEAIAYPKNRPQQAIPLQFVRIEPYVTPKISLTGSSREKVDTRVLQMIYTFQAPTDVPLYIGQQVDVYIKRDDNDL